MKIKFNNKKIEVSAVKLSKIGMFFGLMFRTKNTKNLLFEFPSEDYVAIHSFFVFFDFLAIWLDDKNNVLSVERVKPFRAIIKPKKPSKKLLEIPINKKNKYLVKIFDEETKDLYR